jgi:hypothetical protein
MDVEAILQGLYVAGATIRVDGDALEVSAPRGISAELRQMITTHKPALMTRLRRGRARKESPAVAEHEKRVIAANQALVELESAGIEMVVVAITEDDVRLSVTAPRQMTHEEAWAIRRQKSFLAEVLLRRRCEKGAEYLLGLEERGGAGTPTYEAQLRRFVDLLCAYEVVAGRNQAVVGEEQAA